jgi:dienelactone hydrolase
VVSLLSANQIFTQGFGNGLEFASHVAHYPVCWGYNIGIPGIVFQDLTGAPVLIQIGDLDDYDEGGEACEALAAPFPEVDVQVYTNAHHAWDRLQPAVTVIDPFSHRGAGGEVNIVPNPGKAQQSTRRVVDHFSKAFGLSR